MSEYFTIREADDREASRPQESLVLESLDDGSIQIFTRHSTPDESPDLPGRAYRCELSHRGGWRGDPGFAVHAEWQVTRSQAIPAFLKSRRELFELRGRVLPTFALDLLFASLSDPSRFLILGLYGDREGATHLCRKHPDIVAFARSHPPQSFGARDLTQLRTSRVVSLGSVLSWGEP